MSTAQYDDPEWLKAEINRQYEALSAANVQQVDTGSGGHTMANPYQIRENITFLEGKLKALTGEAGPYVVQGRPVR